MTIHRIKDRRRLLRSGGLVSGFGVSVTSQNNSRGRVGRVALRFVLSFVEAQATLVKNFPALLAPSQRFKSGI